MVAIGAGIGFAGAGSAGIAIVPWSIWEWSMAGAARGAGDLGLAGGDAGLLAVAGFAGAFFFATFFAAAFFWGAFLADGFLAAGGGIGMVMPACWASAGADSAKSATVLNAAARQIFKTISMARRAAACADREHPRSVGKEAPRGRRLPVNQRTA